jgi:hypothetical protein
MRKIFTLSLILFVSEILTAQPLITALYNPIFGDTYIYKIVDDTSTAQPGQSGAGVVWNLASMHGLLTTRQYNWMQTALTNDAVIFGAQSNLAAEIIQNGFSPRYEYYQVGPTFSDDMRLVGTRIDLAYTNFNLGHMLFDYPLSYNQSCTDTMIGTTGVADVNGRSTATYDGYGSLQLEPQSGGNFTNVARLKVEQNYIVNYGPIETHHVETYYWLDHATDSMRKQPIAMISIHDWVDLNGATQREKYALMRQILFINKVPQVALSVSNVMVAPNPFQDKIIFTVPGIDSEIDIQLSDITGRVIINDHLQKSSAAQEESLSMAGVPEGIYFARVSSEKGSVVKKIIKE